MNKRHYKRSIHPITKSGAYQHRIVMSIKLGRLLEDNEVVHHLDGDPSSNMVENLVLFESQAVHMRLEHYLRRKARGLESLFDLETWLAMYNKV